MHANSLNARSEQTFSLAALIPAARQRLVKLGAPLLQIETESRLALAEYKIAIFERKYATTLSQLQREGLPEDASMEMHEDFVEWSGWQRTRTQARQIIVSLQPILEPALASATAS